VTTLYDMGTDPDGGDSINLRASNNILLQLVALQWEPNLEIVQQAMITTDNSPMDDMESAVLISVTELQRQLNDALKQLSPERLQVLADFAAYLANAESEAATQELLAIPGLLERVKQNQSTPKTQYTTWRTLRSDVRSSSPFGR
jgi:hypothetical protein